jgi:molybdopterin-guanine dinucleotide biosynthesis protein A
MILDRTKITGVVLAGGRARRMGGEDKGLIPFRGRPLVAHALEALDSVAGRILVNANRNRGAYAGFGYPVVADATDRFDGPLAGLLSAMRAAETPYVLTVPCDSPLVTGRLLARLWTALQDSGSELCAAHDGEWLHPVFLLAERRLADDLEAYLAGGERKIDTWLHRHKLALADFSDHPELFANVNTPEELAELERSAAPVPQRIDLGRNPHGIAMTDAGRASCYAATAVDEFGETRELELVGERALTVYVDKYEIVTLMTIGTHPELLTLGYLRNQGFIEDIADIRSVQVDWDTEAVAVTTGLTEHAFLTGSAAAPSPPAAGRARCSAGSWTSSGKSRCRKPVSASPTSTACSMPCGTTTRSTSGPGRCMAARCARTAGSKSSWRTWAATTPWTPSPATCGSTA